MLGREDLFAEYEAAIVSAYDPAALDELGWSDPALFCAMRAQTGLVLTAWNPGFARPALAVNEASNQRLLARIQETGLEIWPAESASPDGRFVEPGFLVWDMPVEVGMRIAAEFEQFAIYSYSGEGERSIVAGDPA